MAKDLTQSYSEKFQKNVLIELRNRLSQTKITQAEIGKALGIRQSAVSHLLSGRSQFSLEQLFRVCACIDIKAHDLIKAAEGQFVDLVPMSSQVERAIYKSELHLAIYCAATIEIKASDITLPGYRDQQVRSALAELCDAGVLTKDHDKYIQANVRRVYVNKNRQAGRRAKQKLVLSSWDLNESLEEKDFPLGVKFNTEITDRFTESQSKEIESALWQVFEKIKRFRSENTASGYAGTGGDYAQLWNIHLMLGTALDPRKK